MLKPVLLSILFFCAAAAVQGQATVSPTVLPSPAVSPSPAAGEGRARPELPPEKRQPVRLQRFDEPPVIDGRLDEAVWRRAPALKDFNQTYPGDNIAPSKPTEVYLGYDANTLYVAFRAHDDAGKVRANVAKRDNIFSDDFVGIYLDTFNDQRKAYELFFNPLGIQADGILTEGGGEDLSVDVVMESKGVVTDDGYVVEVAIPFKSLRYEAGADKLWGLQAIRVIKRFNGEQDTWMPLDRERSGFLNQAGRLTGLEGLAGTRTLELIPSLTISENGRRVATLSPAARNADPTRLDPGRFVNEPVGLDPGLTAKLGITPNITLDLALNPDFAQVEADQTVVTTNQRFPIFYEEKRPFFLEGIDIFQTPLTAVHTRAIIAPDVAVKLTGKHKRDSFGLLLASDSGPGTFVGDERLLPRNFPFIDKNAYIGVLRLKHDVGKESSVGLIATTYNFIARHNHLLGFDGRFRLDPQRVFSFQVIGTTSRRNFFDPDAGRSIYRTGNALGYYFNYEKGGRHLSYNLSGVGRTRDYRADVGFTQRTNTNREELVARYNSEPHPTARLVSWRLFQKLGTNFDWQGRQQNFDSETQFRLNFHRQTSVNIGYYHGYERVFEEEFGPKRKPGRLGTFVGDSSERSTDKNDLFGYVESTPSKKVSLFFSLDYTRGAFDFDFGGGPKFPRVSPAALLDPDAPLDPGPGNELLINSTLSYQPTAALQLSLNYTKDKLTRHDTGRVAFDDNIIALRSTYQFTRFLAARARVDYDTLSSNVLGQFLIGWTPNPGTAFYAGYNTDLNYAGYNPFTGQFEPGFQRNGHTFFIKMSYLFRHSLSR
jgi:hypothetical protein